MLVASPDTAVRPAASPREESDRSRTDHRSRGPALVVAGAVATCFLLRLFFLLTPEGTLDGDEALTGIMAHRMAVGRDFYVFFPGQTYNGSIEQFPQALLFRLGVPENALTLRLPQLVLASLSCWLMYLVGLRLLRTRWHAALASMLFAVGPYFLIWKGSRSTGSYVAEMVLVLLGVILAIDIQRESSTNRQSWMLAALGLVLGATYWLTPTGYYLLIPAALWVLPALGRHGRKWLLVGGGALVGLTPLLYWTLRTGAFPTPDPDTPPTTAAQRFGYLTNQIGREFIGVAHIDGRPGWPVLLGRLVLAVLAIGAVVALAMHGRTVLRLVTLRRTGRRPFDIVLLAIPLTVAVYTASRFGWFTKEPRYLFCAFPILLLCLAQVVPRRRAPGVVVGLAVFVFVAAPSVTMLVTHAHDAPAHRDRDLSRAIKLLTNEGETRVYANYWTAMPLQFLAQDRLIVGTLVSPERLLADRRAVDASPSPAWVAARGIDADDVAPMRRALISHRVGFRERRLGVVSIFDRFSRPVRPWQVGLGGRLRS